MLVGVNKLPCNIASMSPNDCFSYTPAGDTVFFWDSKLGEISGSIISGSKISGAFQSLDPILESGSEDDIELETLTFSEFNSRFGIDVHDFLSSGTCSRVQYPKLGPSGCSLLGLPFSCVSQGFAMCGRPNEIFSRRRRKSLCSSAKVASLTKGRVHAGGRTTSPPSCGTTCASRSLSEFMPTRGCGVDRDGVD